MRTVQVSIHHSVKGEAILRVEESRDDGHREAATLLRGSISSRRSSLCHLEFVRADRTIG